MRKFVIFFAMALAQCATPALARQQPAADGYSFDTKEYTQLNPNVTFIEHSSYAELRAAMPRGTDPGDVKAWSNLYADGRCEIHIIDQSISYTPDAVGHEIVHCIYGRFHK